MKFKSKYQEKLKSFGCSLADLSRETGLDRWTLEQNLKFYEESKRKADQDSATNGHPKSEVNPYLLEVFDFLFKKRCRDLPEESEGKLRHFLFSEFLSKLDPYNIDYFREQASELVDQFLYLDEWFAQSGLPKAVPDKSFEETAEKYKESVLGTLCSFSRITVLKATKHYVVFTDTKLRAQIKSKSANRSLWQRIKDPFFFTICFDPSYHNKGLRCELWFYENPDVLDRYEIELKGHYLYQYKTRSYIRCFSKTFTLNEADFSHELEEFIKSYYSNIIESIIDVYQTVQEIKKEESN